MTDAFSRNRSSLEHLRAAVEAMRSAGIAVYLADDMDGVRFADNELRGDQPPDLGTLAPWSVRRERDGTWTMAVAVRGDEHDLYAPVAADPAQLVVRYQAVRRFAEVRLGGALRAAGMHVVAVELGGYDSGWGSRDVHFEIRYTPSG